MRWRVRKLACGGIVFLISLQQAALAAEFRSVGENFAVLYDAPSAKSKKVYVMGRGYPLEVVVTLEGWTKVRDASGELFWVENSNLSKDHHTVLVKAPIADVRQTADDSSPLVFQAQRNVILDLVETTGTGWAHVSHPDGQSGFVKLNQIWGV
jgi:SH3-like domain-containing protein